MQTQQENTNNRITRVLLEQDANVLIRMINILATESQLQNPLKTTDNKIQTSGLVEQLILLSDAKIIAVFLAAYTHETGHSPDDAVIRKMLNDMA